MKILELRKIHFLKLKVQSSLNSQMEMTEEWVSEYEDWLKLSNVKYIRFSWALKSLQMVTAIMKLNNAYSWKESYDKARQHITKQRHYFTNKSPYSQSCSFSCRHVWMWKLDHKEGWEPKIWSFWTVVLEKTIESFGLQGDQTSQS